MSNPKPTAPKGAGSTPSKKDDNSKQRIIAISAIIILALLAINIFLFVSYNNRGKANETLATKLDEAEQLKADLNEQYAAAREELEELRGTNDELNARIDQQLEELEQQKNRIETLLGNKRSLDQARREIKNLTAQVDQYLAEINQLKAENQELTEKTVKLSLSNDSLSTSLQKRASENEELLTAKAALVSENEQLAEDRARLSSKVNIASVIEIENIEVDGIKTRRSGKGVTRKRAKNIDHLQICFTTTSNQVAEPGLEEFFVRIVNPLGETLAIDAMGSGVFNNKSTGDAMRFTKIKEIDYDRKSGNYCVKWAPSNPFQEGNYDIEIYNKGYLAGSTSFELK